jgi:hypothetical protein
MMNMAQGNTYLIRIAGFDGDEGDYTLKISSRPCALPLEPYNPNPANGATDILEGTLLSWDGSKEHGMDSKRSAMVWSKDIKKPKIVYGPDDRLDEYQVTDADILAAGDSTVALLYHSDLIENGDGTFSLPTETYAQKYLRVDPIGTGNQLCPDEPFRDQPAPAWCSGFLVAPDIVATAGHCVEPGECAETAFVFGFVMLDADTPLLSIDGAEIYYCNEVIGRQTGDSDWALIRLDREVTGHNPFKVRTTGLVDDDESLLVIGHPCGLPRKYAGGASVRENIQLAYFQANLDTYGGNSGSAVLNANTLEVEGILKRGQGDFAEDGDCDRSAVCPDSGCPGWEIVVRATEFAILLPWHKYDVYLDSNNPPTRLICSDIDVPTCEPKETLMANTTYYWQVVSKNSCGQTEGPVWSFTTAPDIGDINGDGNVDLVDAILTLKVVSGIQSSQSANPSADVDGDGRIGMAEVIYILQDISGLR